MSTSDAPVPVAQLGPEAASVVNFDASGRKVFESGVVGRDKPPSSSSRAKRRRLGSSVDPRSVRSQLKAQDGDTSHHLAERPTATKELRIAQKKTLKM